MRTTLKTFFLLLVFFSSSSAQAINPLDVIINEIAWMGTETNASDEWIELSNNSNQDINLEDWGLYEAGGEILIEPLTGVIKAKSYYLIERTDDNTLPDLEASQPPTSWAGHGLNNNGEHLQLLDNNLNIIDEVNCQEGWFAGDNETKRTMERKNSLLAGNNPENWQTSQNAGGTPKAKNSIIETEPPAQSSKDIEAGPPVCETCGREPQPKILYPKNVFINEILPSPEGPDAENEWIVPTKHLVYL